MKKRRYDPQGERLIVIPDPPVTKVGVIHVQGREPPVSGTVKWVGKGCYALAARIARETGEQVEVPGVGDRVFFGDANGIKVQDEENGVVSPPEGKCVIVLRWPQEVLSRFWEEEDEEETKREEEAAAVLESERQRLVHNQRA